MVVTVMSSIDGVAWTIKVTVGAAAAASLAKRPG
jgi:hypothetical protein